MSTIKKLIEKFSSNPLPTDIDFDDMIKYLNYYGFELKRTESSHNMFAHADGRLIGVPVVNGKKVKVNYLKKANKIINQQEDK